MEPFLLQPGLSKFRKAFCDFVTFVLLNLTRDVTTRDYYCITRLQKLLQVPVIPADYHSFATIVAKAT